MFRPPIFAIIRWYYNNIKGKTEQEASPLQYYSNSKKKIVFVTRNNEILKRRSVSVGKMRKYKYE